MSKITFRRLLTGPIVLPFTAGDAAAFDAAARMMKRVGADGVPLRFHLYRRSVDARRRDMIRFVYTVAVEADEPFSVDARRAADEGIRSIPDDNFDIVRGTAPLAAPPLVVGMGPAGMFAALMLAEEGYRPILIDRGDAAPDRVRRVETFFSGGELDPESNVQFGAGGAFLKSFALRYLFFLRRSQAEHDLAKGQKFHDVPPYFCSRCTAKPPNSSFKYTATMRAPLYLAVSISQTKPFFVSSAIASEMELVRMAM